MIAAHHIVRGWLESPTLGVIELDRDWTGAIGPRFTMGQQCPAPGALAPAAGLLVGKAYGYFCCRESGLIFFVLSLAHGCDVDPSRDAVYLAGDFNGWQAAVGRDEWRLRAGEMAGEPVLLWRGEAAGFPGWGQRFKFVTGENQWLLPPADAPNAVRDEFGNVNRLIDPRRTGYHLWCFSVLTPLSLAVAWTVRWADGTGAEVRLVPGAFFYDLKTKVPLGAWVRGTQTVFRIFAPRASRVTLFVTEALGREWGHSSAEVAPVAVTADETVVARREWREAEPGALAGTTGVASFSLERSGEESGAGAASVWQVALDRNLHGWYYWYTIAGPSSTDGPGEFEPERRILDPYALAAVGREGPGIVLDSAWVGRGDRSFATPAWHDLVMAEAHVRDLVLHAPVRATAEERRGFSGLRRWVESPDFYLHHLGVNCVELQPVQEFDRVGADEYHWGYMTNNFFAPASGYALAAERASGVRELQELVAAFHRRGMAVVLDVVFNHVGVPAHLMLIDKLYYFETDASGALSNWSGCGNDLRARSAMARRLIIDSCLHLLEAYGVDGFRFDLAELLGADVLRDIEVALKKVRPEVILIAEPWSFRGHIAGALRDTGWASWNDGYRDFVREYVRGRGESARMEYFLRGSPWYFAKWPAQTVNYTESHDDRTWVDTITENSSGDGHLPTGHDRRRTHLMASLLLMSLGIPMISAGQDFLRSKHGVNNTYLRGDLNALDYRRLYRYLGTHAYFADWIAFRRGEYGRLLRQSQLPSEGFFKFFSLPGSPALAVVYNADRSQGPVRLLYAVNPSSADLLLPLGEEIAAGAWNMLADQDRFYFATGHGAKRPVEAQLWSPALSCALWVCRD
jgi:pullulanase/glycogen debranching enzyme